MACRSHDHCFVNFCRFLKKVIDLTTLFGFVSFFYSLHIFCIFLFKNSFYIVSWRQLIFESYASPSNNLISLKVIRCRSSVRIYFGFFYLLTMKSCYSQFEIFTLLQAILVHSSVFSWCLLCFFGLRNLDELVARTYSHNYF